jgi:thiosulfate/3-mercaptopyruvate sulfurtransferase
VTFKTLIDAASLHALMAGDTTDRGAIGHGAIGHGAIGHSATAGRATPGAASLAIIDCRFDLMDPDAGRRAFEGGHIPTARYAHLNDDLSAPVSARSGRHPLPDPQVFAATLGTLGIGSRTQVVAYDEANGSFAARLWWLLRWLGHAQVAVLDGGLKAWIAAGGALTSGTEPPASPPAIFQPNIDPAAVIGSAEIAALLRDPRRLLVDARAAERFAGTVEPIDAVAGHIPGAVNHPFSINLAADGRFLAAEELRRRWQQDLAGRTPANLVAMCGSGVTACHNLLSLEVAGLPGAKLYAGSWSEWIRDPERPVSRHN